MKIPWPVVTLAAFLVAGCASHQAQLQVANNSTPAAAGTRPELKFNSALFGERPDIIPVADIFRLSDEQQADFKRYFENPILHDTPAYERVYSYLRGITMYFGYQGKTFTAEQALLNASGNCLSLAILTTALADLAGVDTAYQLVDSTPVFESHRDIVYRGQHVRTKLLPSRQEYEESKLVPGRSGLLIDYFPAPGTRFVANITPAEYIAMYYNNQASEAIAQGDYNTAFWLLQKTLELTPDSAGALNSMAVVHRRAGDLDKAGEIFEYGITHLDDKVALLRNYRVLLEQQGRHDEVARINKKLAQIDDPNPFDWLHAGHGAYRDGDFREAVQYYKKAAKIAPYLHESYAGMAKAYYMIGDFNGAERAFRTALEKSQRLSTRSMYEAKLHALSQGS